MKPESRMSALNRSFRRSFRRKKDDSEKKSASELVEEENRLLSELRQILVDIIQPYHDDVFFRRCLKAKASDLKEAEKLVRLDVNYRRIIRAGTVVKECKLPEVTSYAGSAFLGFDKEGCTVRYAHVGHLDMKGFIHSMSTIDIMRLGLWYLTCDEDAMKENNKKTGKNAYQYTLILDMEDFSANQIMYKPVFDTAMLLLKLVQEHFYDVLRTVYIVNAPSMFPTIYKALRPVIQEDLHRRIKIYGYNDWKDVLLEHIDAEVLPQFLGGTRVDENNDPRCSAFIPAGGPIPEEYHAKPEHFLTADSPGAHAVTVPAGSFLNIPIEITEAGSIIRWHINSKDNDIGIGVFYKPDSVCEEAEEVLADEATGKKNGEKDKSDKAEKGEKDKGALAKLEQLTPIIRSQCQLVPEMGLAISWKAGTHILHLDNSYSWMSPKQVFYKIEVELPTEE